jgi:ribosomal protein S18 acetylase RimI-like enzyme
MIEIRQLSPSDAGIYQTLRLEALQKHPDAFGSSHDEAVHDGADALAQFLGWNTLFGAFESGSLVGKAGFYTRPHAKLSHKGVLFGMYVKEAARRKGIGSRLLNAVVAHAQGHVETLQLTVALTNAAAVAFYESHGFARYGVEPRALKLNGRYIDEALMEKPLGLD